MPNLNRGSTQPLLTQGDLAVHSLAIPSTRVLQAFENCSGGCFRLIEESIRQSRSLATIRDALLPKLLSGEIRVAEAEKLAEDVA